MNLTATEAAVAAGAIYSCVLSWQESLEAGEVDALAHMPTIAGHIVLADRFAEWALANGDPMESGMAYRLGALARMRNAIRLEVIRFDSN